MKELNSVLLEGILEEVYPAPNTLKPREGFILKTSSGPKKAESSYMKLRFGTQIQEPPLACLALGDRVRIVGSLKAPKNYRPYIQVEHWERKN